MIHYSDRHAARLSSGCHAASDFLTHVALTGYCTVLSYLALAAWYSFICQPCGAFFSYIYTFVYTDGDAALAYLPRSYPPAAAWYSLIRRRRSCRFYCQCSVANTSVGNRPCRYYRSPAPKGRAGFIFNTPAAKSTRRFPLDKRYNPLIPLKSGVFEDYAQRPHKQE